MVEDLRLIELVGVTKEFDGYEAVSNMNLYIRKKEFVTLLGPSGCGKTTTLRMIGGFETPTRGKILFGGADMTEVPPYRRRVNTVFQKYALFPHLNVFDNVAFGLTIAKVPKADIKRRVAAMLEMVGLKGFEKRGIDALSGGQQQRVAIARALVNNPYTIIADEPTGNLDPARSLEIMMLLERINQLGTTVLVVTHEKDLVNKFQKRVITLERGIVVSDGIGYNMR